MLFTLWVLFVADNFVWVASSSHERLRLGQCWIYVVRTDPVEATLCDYVVGPDPVVTALCDDQFFCLQPSDRFPYGRALGPKCGPGLGCEKEQR